jgi:oxygen-independent coproporphyrinogen-3 oxidase
MLDAMIRELELRWTDWPFKTLGTLYFGGGTPSILEPEEWAYFIERVLTIVGTPHWVEFTLEANPEDIQRNRLRAWSQSGVNRLSIGIQSLSDQDLAYMNRAHDSQQAVQSVRMAQDMGIDNLSIDLIYGTPWKDHRHWESELQWVIDNGIPHLSAYALTVEEKTALHHHIQRGKTPSPDEKRAEEQFLLLASWADSHNWDHYEISNLCKPGFRAQHNSRYWNGTPYLGIGPSAHSFNGQQRLWNISNNALYMSQAELSHSWQSESETLNETNKINELIMTQLRLSEGLNTAILESLSPNWLAQNRSFLEQQMALGNLNIDQTQIILSPSGRFMCDFITSQLMVSEV